VKNKSRPSKDGGSTTRYFLCRKHESRPYVSKVEPGGRMRQRCAREALGCGMKMKTVTTASSVTATRTGEWQDHCHELELLDYQKKNSGIMTLAAQEASRGNKISVVADTLTARYRPLERTVLKDLGGHWLTLADVHNSAAAHKAAHPDTRRRGEETSWVEQLDDAESQQARPAQKAITEEQWLQKKAEEWDQMEEKRKQEEEDRSCEGSSGYRQRVLGRGSRRPRGRRMGCGCPLIKTTEAW
ncbi:2,5-diamino-6-(ribosylamino)-4(3H)-pyrimidinone 5'-phosphate reductase, partial [Xylographa parallela]|nr:2,5-diamino-6-(ribosylamino)-4(3H)-pyrimidinone 5'-phosphate reductase [Xylographa parallela]